MFVHKYVDQNGLSAMLAIKKSRGVTPEVNVRNLLCTGDEANKQAMHHGFETHHRSSKQGYQRPRKKTDVLHISSNKSSLDTTIIQYEDNLR